MRSKSASFLGEISKWDGVPSRCSVAQPFRPTTETVPLRGVIRVRMILATERRDELRSQHELGESLLSSRQELVPHRRNDDMAETLAQTSILPPAFTLRVFWHRRVNARRSGLLPSQQRFRLVDDLFHDSLCGEALSFPAGCMH